MNTVKMGFTIEEAAECTGIGRNTMRKLVDWGKLPVLKVMFAKWNDHPFSFRKVTQSPRRLRAKYTPRTNLRFVLRVFRPCGEPVSQLAGLSPL